jgi:hypothetical protein
VYGCLVAIMVIGGTTGLTNHFTNGCPGDTEKNKMNLIVTLMDVILEKVERVGHDVVGCECHLCSYMKIKIIKSRKKCDQRLYKFPGGHHT